MKSAGYDLVLLINENLLNQISGAMFYSGFLTINGDVDLYKGTLRIFNKYKDIDIKTNLGFNLLDNKDINKKLISYLNFQFRAKMTREPLIDFYETESGTPSMRLSIGLRFYLYMWESIEVKFETNICIALPFKLNPVDSKLTMDFSKAVIEEFSIKNTEKMKNYMQSNMHEILTKILNTYFKDKSIEQQLSIPCLSNVVKDISDYIQPSDGSNILPIDVCAIKMVSHKVIAIAINTLGYKGGDYDELGNFAANCSVALAVSEAALHKIYDYVWENSNFTKLIGGKTAIALVKSGTDFSISALGTTKIGFIDKILGTITAIMGFVEKAITKCASLGFLEGEVRYKYTKIDYDFNMVLKKRPKFDLQDGNKIVIYNMAIKLGLGIRVRTTIQHILQLDVTGWLPDFIPDKTISKETLTFDLLNHNFYFDNVELRYGEGKLEWNPIKNAYDLVVTKVNLYWDCIKSNNWFLSLPEKLVNYIIDCLEDDIVKAIPRITVTPSINIDMPFSDYPATAEVMNLIVTNSEFIGKLNIGFDFLEKRIKSVPRYIANTNNKEVHKIGCGCIDDIYENHQLGYHLLIDALDDGYDGCNNCLPAFHKR